MLTQTSNYTDNSQKFRLENEYIFTPKIVLLYPSVVFFFLRCDFEKGTTQKVGNTIMTLTSHSVEQKAFFFPLC